MFWWIWDNFCILFNRAIFGQSLAVDLILYLSQLTEVQNKVYIVLDVLGYFVSSCYQCTREVILPVPSLLGRFPSVFCFLNLDEALTVVCWSPIALEITWWPVHHWWLSMGLFLRNELIDNNQSVKDYNLMLNSFWLGLCCFYCLFVLLCAVIQVLFRWLLDSRGMAVLGPGCS